MAKLNRDNAWKDTSVQTKQNSAYTFSTEKKYVDKNITLNINVPGINLENNQSFYINDGINTWNWTVDANGNVSIT